MKAATKEVHVRINGAAGLQNFLDSGMRTTHNEGKAIRAAERERQLAQFERARSFRDRENQEDTWGNLHQFVYQDEVSAAPRIAGP